MTFAHALDDPHVSRTLHLRQLRGHLQVHRDAIVAALDFLFLGI